MNNDTIRRDDLKPVSRFEALPADVRRVLARAAARGAANSTPAIQAAVGADWIMVPSKRGLRQVVVTATRAFVI